MTVDVARRTRRQAPRPNADAEPTIAPLSTIAIGELEQTVFDCPSCSRPLALGERRCPGCRTRLVNGVALSKASLFVAVGLAIGVIGGAAGGALLGLGRTGGTVPAAALGGAGASPQITGSTGSTAPTASARPASSPSIEPAATGPDGIPPMARSALVQVSGTNDRLALAGDGLRAALAARTFDASAVAQTLRSVSADSLFGEQLADRVAAWPTASSLATELGTFYGAVHAIAAHGLVASVRNEAAYKSAAIEMVELLDGMTAIDAAITSTANSAGLELPAPTTTPAP